MLGHAVLLVAIAGACASLADDGTRSLAEAVGAINQQAAKSPESRGQSPLTEDEVVKSIEKYSRPKPLPEGGDEGPKRLSDEEFQKLQRIVTTRRLPKEVVLRQFVRYNDGTCVEHGWWVRLILMRQDTCPFSLTVRQESAFRRPYTQKERQFQAEMRRTGLVPTMGRLVAYFEEDPKCAAVQEFSAQEADRLAQAVKKAIQDGKTEDLLQTFHWEKVDEATRTWVRQEAEQLVKRQLASVSVSPRRFGGRLTSWWGLRIWDPNLPVLGYVVLEFADKDKDAPRSIWLEFGETRDGARLVNYIVSRDDGPRMIGKPLPGGGFSVQSFLTNHPEKGWSEFYSQIDAPDELPALQNANLELWKLDLTRRETPRAEKPEPKPLQ